MYHKDKRKCISEFGDDYYMKTLIRNISGMCILVLDLCFGSIEGSGRNESGAQTFDLADVPTLSVSLR